MNGTFRKGRDYKLRQVPFKDITVTYVKADGHGKHANRFYFEYTKGLLLRLDRGKIHPNYIQTRVCLEQPRLRRVLNVG